MLQIGHYELLRSSVDHTRKDRIRARWMKWGSALRVLRNHRIPIKLKGKFYKVFVKILGL